MAIQIIKTVEVTKLTHDVLRIVTEKPPNYHFEPGQATELGIYKPEWKNERRPFTFTSLPKEDHLEFTIKIYPEHKGVTNELQKLKAGDELIIDSPWGTISYKGEGLFIAGGAGITPFISIIRHLQATNKIGNNKLIFANKSKADIINESEFRKILGNNFINILSDEKADHYAHGYITEDLLKQAITDRNNHFYVCGPPIMMDIIEKQLHKLNINPELIVKEGF